MYRKPFLWMVVVVVVFVVVFGGEIQGSPCPGSWYLCFSCLFLFNSRTAGEGENVKKCGKRAAPQHTGLAVAIIYSSLGLLRPRLSERLGRDLTQMRSRLGLDIDKDKA